MKKTVFLLALLLGATGAAQAQSKLRLGLKAGGSLSDYTGSDARDADPKGGFHAGVLANYAINERVSLQPELLYSQKGAKFANLNLTQKVNYIDIPVLAHIDVKGLFFELGPQVGFLVAAKNQSGSVTTDFKNNFNDIDFGYALGLGYQLSSGPGIGLRYNGGFTNMRQETTVGNTTYQLQRRHSVFQLYLNYLLGGKE